MMLSLQIMQFKSPSLLRGSVTLTFSSSTVYINSRRRRVPRILTTLGISDPLSVAVSFHTKELKQQRRRRQGVKTTQKTVLTPFFFFILSPLFYFVQVNCRVLANVSRLVFNSKVIYLNVKKGKTKWFCSSESVLCLVMYEHLPNVSLNC